MWGEVPCFVPAHCCGIATSHVHAQQSLTRPSRTCLRCATRADGTRTACHHLFARCGGGGGGRLAPASRPTARHGCCAQCLPPSPAHRRTPGESFLPKCVLATSDRATNHPKTRWLKTTYQSPCSRGGTEHFLCFLWSQAGHSGDGKSKAAWSTAAGSEWRGPSGPAFPSGGPGRGVPRASPAQAAELRERREERP